MLRTLPIVGYSIPPIGIMTDSGLCYLPVTPIIRKGLHRGQAIEGHLLGSGYPDGLHVAGRQAVRPGRGKVDPQHQASRRYSTRKSSVAYFQRRPDAEFFVFGVVTEYCVRCTAKGLLDLGRGVSIVTDAIEQLEPAAGSKTIAELTVVGAKLITTEAALARLHSASARP